MHNLSKQIVKLFGYSKHNANSFELDEEDSVFNKTMIIGWEYFFPLNLWSEMLFKNSLNRNLAIYKTQNKISKPDALDIIEKVSNELESAKREVFLVFPIVGAKISKSISFGCFTVINAGTIQFGSHEITNDQFLDELSKLYTVDRAFWNDNINYVKSSNSPGFLQHPILIIKEIGFIYEISQFANPKLKFILRMLNIFGKAGEFRYLNTLPVIRHNVDHLLVFNSDKLLKRSPLPRDFRCKFEIDFLTDETVQGCFEKSYEIYNSISTTLKSQFLASLKLLDLTISQSNYGTESAAMKALFLSMSLESLLNANFRGEIKSKIGEVAEKFLLENGITNINTKEEIIEVYIDRSKFVHSGQSNLDKYLGEWRSGNPQSESLKNAIIAHCLIILEFIKQYDSFEETKKVKALDKWHEKIRNYVGLKKKNFLFKFINKFGNYLVRITD